MGAIVMDDVIVNENVIIGAGAVVTEKMVLESNNIYAGVPAKKIKSMDQKNFEHLINRISNNYVMYADWFK
jgi:carbonic anhydrase/acetyltransferase-like protein (isoleucine patch superfamily)